MGDRGEPGSNNNGRPGRRAEACKLGVVAAPIIEALDLQLAEVRSHKLNDGVLSIVAEIEQVLSELRDSLSGLGVN